LTAEQVTLKEHVDSRLDTIDAQIRGVYHRLDEIQSENRADHDHVRELIGDHPGRLAALEAKARVIGAVSLGLFAGVSGALVNHFLG
jgi:hypothetical protein